ncbi:MAG: cache domain-containing protein [Nitrospirae bacterium]|nr:cache domain-containing protein [Nitrospirota bacterium]
MKGRLLTITITFIVLLTIFLKTGYTENCQSEKDSVVSAVKTAALGLSAILKDISDESEKIAIIKKMVYAVRFLDDKSGYFYVYDYNCKNIVHPDKTFDGKNLIDYKDAKGKYVIRELSEVAKKGGGFVVFYWKKPIEGDQNFSGNREIKKFGYVEPIAGTEYFIGSGSYEKQ